MACYLGVWLKAAGRLETQRAETVTTDTDPALVHEAGLYTCCCVLKIVTYRLPLFIARLFLCSKLLTGYSEGDMTCTVCT